MAADASLNMFVINLLLSGSASLDADLGVAAHCNEVIEGGVEAVGLVLLVETVALPDQSDLTVPGTIWLTLLEREFSNI